MPIAAVVSARNMCELAQLLRRQQPVGYRHAQHRRVALDIEAVAQPQWPELVLAQPAGEETARLVPKLGDPLIHPTADRFRRRGTCALDVMVIASRILATLPYISKNIMLEFKHF